MKLIPRDEYVKWLLSYKDKKIIKVITGLRRVGKSTIFKLFIEQLKDSMKVSDSQILSINFEEMEYSELKDKNKLHDYIMERVNKNSNSNEGSKTTYVFLDEVQNVPHFEQVIDSLFIKDNIDIYITGSNAKFLSSEIATLLTGRYVEINVLPLSFKEYCSFYLDRDNNNNNNNNRKDIKDLFMSYITYGALPGATMFEVGSVEQREYLENVYKTILEKDVLKRNSSMSKYLVESILSYIIYNSGCLVSTKKITDYINSSNNNNKELKVSYNTVSSYFQILQDCYFIYKADRYDVVGKEYLKQINKYYITDTGFKYYLLNNKDIEIPRILENLVFLELIRRRYKVVTGKVRDFEVDFIVKDNSSRYVPEIKYIQVAVSILDEDKLHQELRPLQVIKDNYPKYIITLDDYYNRNEDGVKVINAIDFLLGEEI